MRRPPCLVSALCLILSATPARAQQTAPPAQGAEGPAVAKGVDFLRGQLGTKQGLGETALAALTLLKAEVPLNDPALAGAIGRVRAACPPSGYQAEKQGGHDIYEAATVIMALSNLDASEVKPQIDVATRYIIALQKANGSWDYANRTAGDTSISQFALLGLWEAENAGIKIPPKVYDRAARWFLSVQSNNGSWIYHPDEPGFQGPTISMTAAGAGSLLICQRQLAKYRRGSDTVNPYLLPLTTDPANADNYAIESSAAAINSAINRGTSWLAQSYVPTHDAIIGQSAYYGLYGVERLGALLGKERLGASNWFDRGLQFVLTTQKADGSWHGTQHGDVPNTCWAILFATRATKKTITKIEVRRLGGGQLLGGRGLPSDLSSLTVAQGRVVVRPMSGAIEGMLAVLEDPRALNAESALAGLVTRYHAEGPKALRPFKDRFRKLLTDRDPGVRRVAAWALGRTADLDVAPLLIKALDDPDPDVVSEARTGLQVLSRKLEGFGPRPGAPPEEKAEAIRKWREWYESVRPPDLVAPEDAGAPSGPERRAAP